MAARGVMKAPTSASYNGEVEWIGGAPIYKFPAWMSDEVSLGTTLVAVEYDGGVVIGADTRTSTGTYVASRVTDKLTKVTERIYACRSGSAADTQAITDAVRNNLEWMEIENGKPVTVELAANSFQDFCYQYRDSLTAGIIVAGWDEEKGGQVYAIPLGGMKQRQAVASGGSGSTYIYGFVDQAFKRGMTAEECFGFVKNAVSLAIKRDGSSGGCARLAVINKDGVKRHVFLGNELETFDK